MCSVPSVDTSAIEQQVKKSNVLLSNSEVARTTGEKKSNKRTVSSLRVPLKNRTNTTATGVNTADETTGLNIPV